MNAHYMLELTLNEILHVINPSKEDWDTRMEIINEIKNAVSAIESLRGATVEPFGSFLSQLFTCRGDLDISIELSNGAYISTAARKLKQSLLGDVQKALRKTGAFKKLQFVVHARVPILKLESKHQSISCDVSINNLSGHMKSKFLWWISVIDQRFRDMVLLVKEWAKANDINNSKTGTFNSYSLTLLVIFHFQTCVPAILPPLKDIYPGNMAVELIGVRADVERRIEEVAFDNITKFRKERRPNRCSLSELFTSFFAKFCDLGTRATNQGISTFTGQWEAIHTNTRWLPRTYAIFIEDPFEQPENTARSVTSGQLTRITETFASTYHGLISPNQSRNTLIPLLVPYEISNFFPGAAFRNSFSNGGPYPRANHRMHRGSHSSAQFQRRFQKAGPVNRPKNGSIQNPKQASGRQVNQANGNAGGQATQGQAQQPKPQLPRALVAGQVKGSQGQAQQVWRPKQSDN